MDEGGTVSKLCRKELRKQKLMEYLAAKGTLKPPNPKPYLRHGAEVKNPPTTAVATKGKENQGLNVLKVKKEGVKVQPLTAKASQASGALCGISNRRGSAHRAVTTASVTARINALRDTTWSAVPRQPASLNSAHPIKTHAAAPAKPHARTADRSGATQPGASAKVPAHRGDGKAPANVERKTAARPGGGRLGVGTRHAAGTRPGSAVNSARMSIGPVARTKTGLIPALVQPKDKRPQTSTAAAAPNRALTASISQNAPVTQWKTLPVKAVGQAVQRRPAPAGAGGGDGSLKKRRAPPGRTGSKPGAEKLPIRPTTRGPSAGTTTRGPSAGTTTREPSAGTTTRGPSAGTTTQGRSAGTTTRGRSAGTTTRGPSAGTTTRGRSAGTTTRGPSAGTTTRGPSAGTTTRGRSAGTTTRGRSAGTTTRGPSAGTTTRGPSAGTTTRGPSAGTTTRGPSAGTTTRGPSAGTTTRGPSAAAAPKTAALRPGQRDRRLQTAKATRAPMQAVQTRKAPQQTAEVRVAAAGAWFRASTGTSSQWQAKALSRAMTAAVAERVEKDGAPLAEGDGGSRTNDGAPVALAGSQTMPRPARAAAKTGSTADPKTPGGQAGVAPQTEGKKRMAAAQEERMRRLQEWRDARGISYKRPPMPVKACARRTVAVHQPYWTDVLQQEEEAQSLIYAMGRSLDDCIQLLEEGCPVAQVQEVLSRLPTVAQKFAKYWICRARLMELQGQLEVLPLFQEAVRVVLEPVDELRTVVFEILRKKETQGRSPLRLESATEEEEEEEEEGRTPGLAEAQPAEDPAATPRPVRALITGDQGDSSVVKYKITATPGGVHSQRREREPRRLNGHELRFFTPVRRSVRIERSSLHYPAALQDHDLCVASYGDLVTREEEEEEGKEKEEEEEGEEEGGSPAIHDTPVMYVYRENEALGDKVHVQLVYDED